MDATQSLAQEVRCLRVSGITGMLGYLNGTYHEEPEHSDGVPCYRKYCSRGASHCTITRRGGYWFFDTNHRESSDGFTNDGCGVRYENPKDVASWFLEVNGDCFGTAVVKVEEVSAPYQGCAPGWPVGYWYDESGSDEEDEEEDYYEEEYESDELPEDDTEKAQAIKDAVKAVGEKVFDIQDQLKEGDYLKLMNLLQLVANKVDS